MNTWLYVPTIPVYKGLRGGAILLTLYTFTILCLWVHSITAFTLATVASVIIDTDGCCVVTTSDAGCTFIDIWKKTKSKFIYLSHLTLSRRVTHLTLSRRVTQYDVFENMNVLNTYTCGAKEIFLQDLLNYEAFASELQEKLK